VKKVEQQQIYSIRKNKAYGASSVLIGLMGTALLLGGLTPTVQAEENDVKPEPKPVDASASDVTNASTVETAHLIVTSSQPTEGAIKPESTSTDAPKLNEENASTNAVNPTNSTPSQPKEGVTTPTATKTEAKPEEAATAPKRAVSIVYKVRYVDRKSHQVVHEVTKTKTVETTEAKAKASVTEIGGELANDSQLENYYVPDGNPTTFTKEIVEGEDNVFVYEVEGSNETETAKRDVTLKYTIDYMDEKSGLVLASEEKEEKVSTNEAVAKKEVTVQPSLAANERLKDWVLSDGAPASQKLTLTEGTVGKVTFKLQKSEPGKVRNKRGLATPVINGQPYLTLENKTVDFVNYENMTLPGNGRKTYEIVYQIGASNLPNNDINELVMTEGAERLGFTLNREAGLLTKTLTPTRDMEGTYEVGFYVKSNPNIKVSGTIQITATTHYGFMIMNDESQDKVPIFDRESDTSTYTRYLSGNYTDSKSYSSQVSPFYRNNKNSNSNIYLSDYVENNLPKTEVTIDGLNMPSTPFGYFMSNKNQTVQDTNQDTKRYYTMLPIFAPMNRSTDFANNDKQGLSITKFTVLEASEGVEAKLIDLRHDKAPDKGVYSNNLSFQTVIEYDTTYFSASEYNYTNTPYYLQFTKLPKLPGNYFTTVEITDSLGLTKKIRLNFTTYENSISSERDDYRGKGGSYALTTADTLFERNKEYVNKENGLVTIPISDKEQILGKVTLNKKNAYIKSDEFPAGLELRPIEGKVDGNGNPTEAYVVKKEGVKVQPGVYSFSVKAHDGHFQDGGSRRFDFEIVDAINPIADQHWREGSVPPPISISMENHSHITGIRVKSSGNYAYFEGNAANSSISVYGLKRTEATQKARVYVTYTDGAGKSHETFTDFNYEIEPNTVDGLNITVTNDRQEISEGENFQDMVIKTSPSEGVTIKVDKTKLPKGTRLVGNVIKGKGLYEGVYDIPVLAVKGDVIKSAAVHLVVKPKEFIVADEISEVEVLSNNIMSVSTDENGETVKTPVTRFGLQNIPDDATVIYSSMNYSHPFNLSDDRMRITGIPKNTGQFNFKATIYRRGSNGQIRTTTSNYTILVRGLLPSLTISSADQPTDAYSSSEKRLIAPIGTQIPPITIKHDSLSILLVKSDSLPEGLRYTYDETTHTGTITGTPSMMRNSGYIHEIQVLNYMPSEYADKIQSGDIYKTIYIEVTPMTSALSINHAEQTFSAAEEMTPITVSDFDERATIELEGAPTGVSYNLANHQITGTPVNGPGRYVFNVKANMPETLGGQVTRKQVTLTVVPVEPTLSATPTSAAVIASESIPEITITKDSVSTLSEPSVMIEGTSTYTSLSSLGLSYDAASKKITGTPTIVGNHTIHLATTLSERYTGISGGKTLTLDIPLTVRAKEFDFVTNQEQTTTVLSPITPISLTVPEGIEVSVGELPSGLTYDAERKMIQGTPNKVGTYTITVTGRPRGFSGNDKTATLTIHVNHLPATIGITNKEQTVQVGTAINDVTITSSEHANIYGIDALLSAVSGNNSGIVEANIANYFLGAYGLTYNATNHTITGTPTKTGRIVFTFIARTSENLGAAEARETVVLNVVESLSKIPVITEVGEGTSVVKGTGVAGATVTVTLPTGDEKTALVSGDGSWSVDTTSPLGKGQSISARQKEVNKTMSNDISATVVANAGLELSKEPIVDAIIEGATTITGKGENGSTINVTLPNGTVKTTTVTDGRWTVTLESPVAKGDNILVSQTQPNKATSPSVSATAVPTITKGDKGEDGAAGQNGQNGRDGKDILNGTSDPTSETGKEGDKYVNTTTGDIFVKKNGQWEREGNLKGPKGDKGEAGTNGVDGKSPVITMTDNGDGTHSIIIRNPDGSESTTKVKDGKDGKTATITTTENPDGSHTITVINPDGASKEIVVRDGKTPKVEVIDNGNGSHTVRVTDGDGNVTNTIIKDGKDGKSATATTTENTDGSHTVTITNPDGTTNNFIVKNGRDGVDGRTPTATVRNNNDGSHTIVITNPDGVTTETTIRDGQSPKVTITDEQNGTHKITVLNGDGTTTETIIKDGKSPVATVTDNHDGTYTIRVENGNGTVSETTVRDGKSPTAKVVNNGDGTHTVTIVNSDGTTTTTIVRDGQSPKLEVIDNHNGSHTIKVIGTDGKETSTTIFDGKSPTAKIVDNGDGTHKVIIVDSNGQQYTSIIKDGKDGKDGKSPIVTVRNNNDGTHTITIINPDGSKTETIIKDGKDGKSPEVTVEDNGNGTHTITIININGIVYKTIIRDGKCGCNDKPGGHTPGTSTNPKPDEPTFAMPAPPVHDTPEFNSAVPGMPEVYEKPEYSGIPTNPKSGGETPENSTNTGGGTPENPVNSTPGVPTSVGSTNSIPGVPTSVGSTNSIPGVPTSVDSTQSNPEVSSAVNEYTGSELPKTGTKVDYLPMLLGSSILLALYVGRRKEE